MVTRVSDLVDQGVDIAHPSCPAHEDIKIWTHGSWVSSITTGILAFIDAEISRVQFGSEQFRGSILPQEVATIS